MYLERNWQTIGETSSYIKLYTLFSEEGSEFNPVAVILTYQVVVEVIASQNVKVPLSIFH